MSIHKSLAVVLASAALAVTADATPIQLVDVSAEFYYAIPPTPGYPNGQNGLVIASVLGWSRTPQQVGLDLSTLAPGITLDAILSHSVTNQSFDISSKAKLSVPADFTFDAQGRMSLDLRYKVVGDPATLYDVFETDEVTGRLRTTLTESIPTSKAYADAESETILHRRRWAQERIVAGTGTVTSRRIMNLRTGEGNVNPGPPEFNFDTPEAFESTIHYAPGRKYLTTVFGGVPFTVTASLAFDVQGRQGTESLSEFANTLHGTLEATPVPEPATFATFAAGLILLWVLRSHSAQRLRPVIAVRSARGPVQD
jgi:hypothetical protein